jgi:transcription-repair coupling factor (superfamily II helicase)
MAGETAQALTALGAHVRAGTPRVRLHGCDGSFAACAAGRMAAELPPSARPLVVVTPDEPRAIALARDIAFFLAERPIDSRGAGAAGLEGADRSDDPAAPPRVLHLPSVETSPYAELSPDRRAVMRRLATLFRLSQGFAGQVLVASAPALLRRVIPRVELGKLTDILLPEAEIRRDALLETLARAGYGRTPVVEDPGTFAVRGGVIDLFVPLYRYPARVELFGDIIESIRFFDPVSQRTMRPLDELYIHPVRETVLTAGADPRPRILAAADAAAHPSAKTRALLEQIENGQDFFGAEALAPAFHARMAAVDEYLPAAARWLVLDPSGVKEAGDRELQDALDRFEHRRADHRVALEPREHYLDYDELVAMLDRAPARIDAEVVELLGDDTPAVRITVESNRQLAAELTRARAEKADELLRPLVTHVRGIAAEGFRVAFICPGVHAGERLRGLLRGYDLETELHREPGAAGLFALPPGGAPHILLGPLTEGFRLTADGLVVIAEEEIFGARAHTRRVAQRAPSSSSSNKRGLADFSQLQTGDYVVHAVNGVGRYLGLTKLPLRGTPIDFLHLQYDGGVLYLPVYRLGEVSRYVGADGGAPRLDRMGGATWDRTRRRVSAEVKQLAEELLKLYAQRQALPGHAFPPADDAFQEFEATFPFEETPDQQRAIDEVIADMEKPRPMDRLVCGDVGYGKTEVALRAALKAVLGGKQVAVLAPTTVLVEQHWSTFTERFRGWPVRVAALSRFQPRAEQLEVVKKLADSQLDIVVGTHRLLSNDVRWKDLGLIIVDEEQRFGVAHKERLKKLRTQVDVLTLTATPIPRTMHMAMMGLREVSIIATPPADRLAIRTFVSRPDDDIIKEGLRRELARGGQAFFVCHRIGDGKTERSIEEWAGHIRELVPGARVVVGHGQMDAEILERVMIDFVDYKHDVLVSTTIIESGLDIPRANTMFVHRADSFGLAQLYQLRGRIGRGKERAFCYLMVPPLESLSSEAKQRLQVLQRFTELGAGFQIASHDLEIRGAGDLLGAQQSGQIAAVGFDMYVKILEEAVAELRGSGPIARARDPELNVDVPAFIPDEYVPDTGQRLDLYKRLAEAEDEDGVRAVLEEIGDRYGELPAEVKLLGELMVVKAYARRLGAVSIDLSESRLVLALDSEATPLKPDKVLALVNKKGSPYRLTPDMRLARTLPPGDSLAGAKRCLLELRECA